jgi:enamine deaminase RidA (YjgF/YER057c/UK114 family)
MRIGVIRLIVLGALGAVLGAPAGEANEPAAVTFTGPATSQIASGVGVPAGRAYFWTSGIVPSGAKLDGTTVYERYGDTYAQAVSCLKNIAAVLATQGLGLKDVVYLRVYVVPDANKGGKSDFAGWFKAYSEFFNTPENPVKTARSTVGVAALVNPDWLIEVEAVAVYPGK